MNLFRFLVRNRIYLGVLLWVFMIFVLFDLAVNPARLRIANNKRNQLQTENQNLKKEIDQLKKLLQDAQDGACEAFFRLQAVLVESQWTNRSKESTFTFFTLTQIHHLGSEATYGISTIRNLVQEVIKTLESQQNIKLTKKYFINGVFKVDPELGSRFHLWFKNPGNQSVVEFVATRSFGGSVLIPGPSKPSSPITNIVVPVSGRSEAFKIFLENLLSVFMSVKENVYLTLVFYGTENEENKLEFQRFVNDTEFEYYVIVETKENFTNRAKALQLGIDHWKDRKEDVLLFLTDVDVIFNGAFIRRCQNYAVPGSRVYYPVTFSLYNPAVTYAKIPPWRQQLKINQDSGFWRNFGYGMVCVYQRDFLAVGGFGRRNWIDWGEEDVYLFNRFQKSSLGILRAPDPGVIHTWHPKICPHSMDKNKRNGCIYSRLANEGSQRKLAEKFLRYEDP